MTDEKIREILDEFDKKFGRFGLGGMREAIRAFIKEKLSTHSPQ